MAVAVVVCSSLAGPTPSQAQVFLTQEEALALAFPGTDGITRETAFLTPEQSAEVEALSGRVMDRGVVTYYGAHADGEWVGVAWFDAHRVRTLEEVLMVVIDRTGAVRRTEVLKFAEPRDYLPPEGWLRQFQGRTLDRSLDLKGNIVTMTGATLTSRAVTDAVRRVLALHQVVDPFSALVPGVGEGP